jgi:hypothetical protein
MCIGYALRPHLSSRLTWSGRTFLQNPWAFGHYDSHIILATHSGILTPIQSTAACAAASPRIRRSPTPVFTNHNIPYIIQYPNITKRSGWRIQAQASVRILAPLHFRRRVIRPVSCYALFQCVAASKPTSWLFLQLHILPHLNAFGDLSCGSGLFPSRQRNLSHAV